MRYLGCNNVVLDANPNTFIKGIFFSVITVDSAVFYTDAYGFVRLPQMLVMM